MRQKEQKRRAKISKIEKNTNKHEQKRTKKSKKDQGPSRSKEIGFLFAFGDFLEKKGEKLRIFS